MPVAPLALSNLLALRDTYRDASIDGADTGDGLRRMANRHLETASDALTLALLTLGGDSDDRGGKLRRAEQARAFLVEAVTALSRARVYLPPIRTHALPVLMASDPNPDAEITRLHNIATRLLWHNHAYLPARLQATPLPPEEEAQLALVLQGIARNARIDRALRYRWSALSLGVAAVGVVASLPWATALGVAAAMSFAVARVVRNRDPEEST